jgi:hypothetical protein
MVVKTQEDEGLISDLLEIVNNPRKFKMKLNPKKCTFSVPLGKLLRYMVSQCRINPNPEKLSAITKMKPQKFSMMSRSLGCMAALSKFISLLGVKGGPFLPTP